MQLLVDVGESSENKEIPSTCSTPLMFLYPLTTSEHQGFYDVFRRYRNGTLEYYGLRKVNIFLL